MIAVVNPGTPVPTRVVYRSPDRLILESANERVRLDITVGGTPDLRLYQVNSAIRYPGDASAGYYNQLGRSDIWDLFWVEDLHQRIFPREELVYCAVGPETPVRLSLDQTILDCVAELLELPSITAGALS